VSKYTKHENKIIAFAVVLLGILILSIGYTYYYDLIDDVLMKDILSGDFTGTPESRNMQMLWPLAAFVSLLYKIIPAIPWFGIMIIGFQYASLYIFVGRSLRIFDNKNIRNPRNRVILKTVMAVSETFLIMGIMLTHLINVQYTITVAFMASAAVMWLMTSRKTDKLGQYIRSNIVVIIILFLAFMLRSEMLLLMLPFVGLSGLYCWSFEEKFFTRDNIKKYFILAALILASLGIAKVSDSVAYGSSEWKQFVDLFDARTELYDFNVLPGYEDNASSYEAIGISAPEQKLFENYNYAINEEVDAELIWDIASFARETTLSKESTTENLKNSVKNLIYRLTHGKASEGSDYPWNVVLIVAYCMAFAQLILTKKYKGIWRLLLLFAGRSAIWIYILMGKRTPERITDSLFLIEICLLLALTIALIRENSSSFENNKNVRLRMMLVVAFSGILGGIFIKEYGGILSENQVLRAETTAKYQALATKVDDSKYYLLDVYSFVDYIEPVFGAESSIDKPNIDLLGGWIAMSPYTYEKLSKFGFENIQDALLSDDVFLIQRRDRDTDWIINYYGEKNIAIELSEIDCFGTGDDGKENEDDFIEYKING